MSNMPPEEHQAPPQPSGHMPGGGYGGLGRGPVQGAILPVPGNAELVIWLLVEIVLAIVAGISDGFDAHGWCVATTWLTAAYIISRGIAKASRVLEQ
jgi:hypothetical protein